MYLAIITLASAKMNISKFNVPTGKSEYNLLNK